MASSDVASVAYSMSAANEDDDESQQNAPGDAPAQSSATTIDPASKRQKLMSEHPPQQPPQHPQKQQPPPPISSEGDAAMEEEDSEVTIVDPPTSLAAVTDTTLCHDTHDGNSFAGVAGAVNDDHEEIQVVASNATNPNIQFPHQRPMCGVYPFDQNDENDDNGKGNHRERFCPKCYCVVCDVPAQDCQEWSVHCCTKPKVFSKKKDPEVVESEVIDVEDVGAMNAENMADRARYFRFGHSNGSAANNRQPYGNNSSNNNISSRHDAQERERRENASKMRITEVLGLNLAHQMQKALRISEGGRLDPTSSPSHSNSEQESTISSSTLTFSTRTGTELYKMEGDIPQLGLHSSFFVEGVKIGWPFPTILPPQRQMAIHIIKGLKRKLHVVLESPTGTGKSAAILCSVLAWQRYHVQTSKDEEEDLDDDDSRRSETERQDIAAFKAVLSETGDRTKTIKSVPRIIYCSRTHSQVAQMVSSLKKTPYRPKMTVLGSRERMCIHKDVIGPDNKLPTNMACQYRRGNTESERKRLLKDPTHYYDDNDPFPKPDFNGDGPSANNDHEDYNDNNGSQNGRRPAATCPHYRQLSTKRTAEMAVRRFVGNPRKTSCCSVGGEESSFGVHDMEDLVAFGKNPHWEDISIYRGENGKFGFVVAPILDPETNEAAGGCYVTQVVDGDPASVEAKLQEDDMILEVNGKEVRHWKFDQVLEEVKLTPKGKPLLMKVKHRDHESPLSIAENIFAEEREEMELSGHSVCPYYLSRAIQPHTELTFAPYNYILDPSIRRVMSIDLRNTVVVLDEAHNVESTLCEGGSFKYGELDLSQIVSLLAQFARRTKTTARMDLIGTGVEADTSEVAHELLVFVETIISHLRNVREDFENSPEPEKLEEEYTRYKNISHDHAIERSFDGPTGHGLRGKPVGCKPFFTKLGLGNSNSDYFDRLLHYAISFEKRAFGEGQNTSLAGQEQSNVLSRLLDLVSKLNKAAESPEHYYICCTVQANGSLDHVFGLDSNIANQPRLKKNPRKYPFIYPRSEKARNAVLPVCNQEQCPLIGESHGEYCNGSSPLWECHLVLKLLSPGLLLRDISKQCRSLILASGSLAPLPSLCAELNLFGNETKNSSAVASTVKPSQSLSPAHFSQSQHSRAEEEDAFVGRLQTMPKPLEANHVIDLSKQLLAVAIGTFPDGSKLTVNFKQFNAQQSTQHSYPKLGDAIASVIEGVPHGGVLVFLPSYSFLNRCINCWNPHNTFRGTNEFAAPQIWDRLLRSKGKVIVEPNKGQAEFEAARDEYRETVAATGSCVLLAVFRGKMSEGISFNDENARAVICVGLPFPAARERGIMAKKSYNDEQRKLRKNTFLLPGTEWYSQQAYRAVAQALGRCIRHGADYGTVVLMDSRHCDDDSPNNGTCWAHQNLPKWMRGCVRTLSPSSNDGPGHSPILGGYAGLQKCMREFFQQAPAVSKAVRDKWKVDLEKAQERSRQAQGRVFDKEAGSWTATSSSEVASTPFVKKETT